ncbi:hypothetical protein JAAARDRAFT_208717 [Jaapia argillacea MUCL 33604]|uniref:Uncharacterized protein n=1 Tax=Jaapia argillacea MUCL 33604 TaxID=933084 RepID=A0A067PW13_9AGAM|nr:hypothetical protein JAAARDRAFT_208717 [Jaapia argillacea MUCL 33604]
MSDDTLGIDPALQQRVQEVVTSSLGEEAISSELDKLLGGTYKFIPAAANFQGNNIHIRLKNIGGPSFNGKFSPPAEGTPPDGSSDGKVYVRRSLQGAYRIRVSLNQSHSTVFFKKLLPGENRLPGEEEPNPAEEPDEQEYLADPIRLDVVFVGNGFSSQAVGANGFGIWKVLGPG